MKILHFSNSFVDLKAFCGGLQDPPMTSKLTKKLFMTMQQTLFSKILREDLPSRK